MNPRYLLPLALLAPPAQGADPLAQYDAIRALGTLNGVALYCKSLDQVRRLKEAVVANAPKERSFGLAFEESTDASFRAALTKREPCPSPAGFAEQVGAAIEVLRQAFAQP
jgi:hypothetical protein